MNGPQGRHRININPTPSALSSSGQPMTLIRDRRGPRRLETRRRTCSTPRFSRHPMGDL